MNRLFLVVLGALFVTSCTTGPADDGIIVGAVLPLTGPASTWGENVRNGMELAQMERPHIKVLYEDSRGTSADGITAFQHLAGKKVDLVVSILSSVSVPLAKAADDQDILLLATLTAADNITNDDTFRYYSDSTNFAEPSFRDANSPVRDATKIAVLYRNDELGVSVMKHISRLNEEYGKELVFAEPFNPGEKDFASHMLKISSSEAEVLLFVPVTPSEALAIVKAAQGQQINIPLVEASNVFADPNNRNELNAEVYTNVYPFSLDGNSEDFKLRYFERFGKQPNFGAAFGYDVIMLIDRCSSRKEELKQCLEEQKTFTGVTGLATVINPHDFNVPLQFMKIS